MISLFILQNCHVAAKATEMAGRHMPHMRFFGTNCMDVLITLIICIAVVVVIPMIISGYKKAVKSKDLDAKEKNLDAREKDLDAKEKNLDAREKDLTEKEGKLTEVIKEQDKVKKELNDMKNAPAFQNYALFKDICALSKNKDGRVDSEIANKLYTLYKEVKKDNSNQG